MKFDEHQSHAGLMEVRPKINLGKCSDLFATPKIHYISVHIDHKASNTYPSEHVNEISDTPTRLHIGD